MSYQSPSSEIAYYWYPEIWDFVQRVRAAYMRVPFQVTSWWRDVAGNQAVGGNPYSQHLIATAIDAVPVPPYTKEDLASAFRTVGLVPVNQYRHHVHAQLYPAGFLAGWIGD